MANRGARTGFDAYAQEVLTQGFMSQLFDMPVALAMFAKKGLTAGRLGRPGTSAVIGSRVLGSAKLRSLAGSSQRHVFFHTGRVGGGKYLAVRGTTSSTGNERQNTKKRSALVSWSYYEQPIAVENMQLRQARGKFAIGSVISDATTEAMEEMMETLATDVYTGAPSDYTDEVYDDAVGLDEWIHDSNNVLGVDRSSVTGFDGVRITTATTATLSLIDDINIDYDGSGNGIVNKHGKIDVVLVNNVVYKNLKAEALAAGYQLIKNTMPEHGEVGFTGEYIDYNGVWITLDPYCDSDDLYGLTTRHWTFEVDPAENWRVVPFRNLADEGDPGSDDITVSKIRLGFRLVCGRPGANIHYTSVS